MALGEVKPLVGELRKMRDEANNKHVKDHEKSLKPTLEALPGILKGAANEGKSSCRVEILPSQYSVTTIAKEVLENWAKENGVHIKDLLIGECIEVWIGW